MTVDPKAVTDLARGILDRMSEKMASMGMVTTTHYDAGTVLIEGLAERALKAEAEHPDISEIALSILNDILKLDPNAATFLIEKRCTCAPELENHPHIVVAGNASTPPLLGFLGVLNGIMSMAGLPRIEAVFDESPMSRVIGFRKQVKNLAEA